MDKKELKGLAEAALAGACGPLGVMLYVKKEEKRKEQEALEEKYNRVETRAVGKKEVPRDIRIEAGRKQR